jgi:hypothetical protein
MSIRWPFRWSRQPESVDDYLGVLVSLQEAHHYSHSSRTGKTEFETLEPGVDAADEDDPKDGDNETQGMLHMKAAEYTIEGLRKEMRQGRQGTWTTYESKSHLTSRR